MFGLYQLYGLLWYLIVSITLPIFFWISGLFGIISFSTFAAMQLFQLAVMKLPNNLAKRYEAKWALVTGASSGIGKAITEELAQQGINVVLVALDDKLLADSFKEFTERYPSVSFRKCGVNLADPSSVFMPDIEQVTNGIEVTLLFNNAGFILVGLFAETELPRIMANYDCNATSVIPLTHHFLRQMIKNKRKGLIAFTSSSAGYLPGPTATMYSSTKAFVTNFAVTLAAEVKDYGVDVVVMHPSPVQTNFFNSSNAHMESLKQARKAAVGPEVIAKQMIASAGRVTVWDQGLVTFAMRLATKVIDFQFLGQVMIHVAKLMPDQVRLMKESKLR